MNLTLKHNKKTKISTKKLFNNFDLRVTCDSEALE